VALDYANGRTYFGDGTVDPTTKYFGQFGVAIAWSGAHLYVGVDNTHDIGAASSNRPRYVRCGTAVVTGALATGSELCPFRRSDLGAGSERPDQGGLWGRRQEGTR
jgi:hypothetical protein